MTYCWVVFLGCAVLFVFYDNLANVSNLSAHKVPNIQHSLNKMFHMKHIVRRSAAQIKTAQA